MPAREEHTVMRMVLPPDKATLPLAVITSDEAKAILKTSRFRFGILNADVFLQGHFVEQGFEVRLSDGPARVKTASA